MVIKEIILQHAHNVGGTQLMGMEAIVEHKGMEFRFPLYKESRDTIRECIDRDFDRALAQMGEAS